MSNPIKNQHVSPSSVALLEDSHFPRSRGQHEAQARALLSNDVELCRDLAILPVGYYGEDCDFEEFFTPETLLPAAETDPDWGLFRDPHGYNRRHLIETAISAVIDEYRRAFHTGVHLSGRIRLRFMSACREELATLLREHSAMTAKGVA